ncbi:phenylacetic acid degradation protein PaaD [Desulfosarcina ovata subsp. sediminis]|uniref:Phenylacetic acid degradation protein PaaD n=1 Tax=Desulfosarcina ovata subsp. sediminis TaxID=885957 RepID=A0A5K7ZTN1_9BACT|nr:hotdog fold thioesterase [Desulfosarcina ovata]BBO83569.1 phenylacetic acid degradation protein PaaD [Desulfosarcina ovata subsp. sediminis]
MMDPTRAAAIDAHIQNDAFMRFLGAEVAIVSPGHSRVSLTVTEQMTNFHGITHGGVVFALGDLAFAAASNSRGQTAVALNVSITFLNPSKVGDRLVAEARECHRGSRTGLYEITVVEAISDTLIARSQDLVYRKKEWFVAPEPE